jgi:4-hydroxy-tetrahydrodipicolinate synthase
MNKNPFQGTGTALVTPFRSDGSSMRRPFAHLSIQIAEGIDMILPCGTTGEGATLSWQETDRVTQIVIEQARRRVP